MKLNSYAPKTIKIDPQSFNVTIDGQVITCEPSETVSLAQRYYFF
jgi:urease subunit alpha